jgi:sensor histidine kinase YesM
MFDSVRSVQPLTPARLLGTLSLTVLFNTAIAILLTTIGFGTTFWHALLFAQCIGLTICACVVLTKHLFGQSHVLVRGILLGAALLAGTAIGTALGEAISGLSVGGFHAGNTFVWKIVGVSIMFGLIITYFFHNQEQLAASTKMIHEERIKRLSSEKLALEANLKRLQAQVEPHFLFNTLSTIVSLMDTDPADAKAMLMDLTRYLRTVLGRTRDRETTLGQEVELIRAYLDIFKIRMGRRLQYEIAVPQALAGQPLAPMLLQPIVENAVLHGLEPTVEGGQVNIRATAVGGRVKIEIADTGGGMADHHHAGVGLANVRERLARLYGNQARLVIEENQPHGVAVVIEVPMMDNAGFSNRR